jgi:ATP-binding cassette, subfamily A (ABC1), member 3
LFPTNVDVVGQPFSEAAIGACLSRVGNYTTQSDCLAFSGIGYTIQYNFTAIHVAPLYQMLADQGIIREATGSLNFTIQTTIHPLPITNVEQNIGEADDAFTAWFLIILGFPFIAGSFATFVVDERQSKAKHLQTVAGVKPYSYWLSTWLWDVVNYQIPCWITVALMFIFSIDIMTTTEGGVFGGILSLLVLFGPAAASFSYVLSFLFSSPSICNLLIIISSFLVAFGGTLATFILRLIGADPANPRESLTLAAEIVEWILRFCPAFCLGRGLYSAINLESISFLEGRPITVWDDAAILYEVIFLGCESVVYLILAMKIDEWAANPQAVNIWRGFLKILSCQWICDNNYNYYESNVEGAVVDDDVVAEEKRVLNGGANDDLIVMSQLTKIYDTGKKAVDNMSLGIPPGQCFGLLGINGAGKHTKRLNLLICSC